jgi:hypothetical protein
MPDEGRYIQIVMPWKELIRGIWLIVAAAPDAPPGLPHLAQGGDSGYSDSPAASRACCSSWCMHIPTMAPSRSV